MKHPHERGEDPRASGTGEKAKETPPRAWGRPLLSVEDTRSDENTPTSVGKTPCPLFGGGFFWKHPHERGEDRSLYGSRYTEFETPPRAWGRPISQPVEAGLVRNTPTSVGKTPDAGRPSRLWQKHPHERGEDTSSAKPLPSSVETPPRAWGRRALLPTSPPRKRNTPTSVGKTNGLRWRKLPRRKHPHERGEDWKIETLILSATETPPRAWGRLP